MRSVKRLNRLNCFSSYVFPKSERALFLKMVLSSISMYQLHSFLLITLHMSNVGAQSGDLTVGKPILLSNRGNQRAPQKTNNSFLSFLLWSVGNAAWKSPN